MRRRKYEDFAYSRGHNAYYYHDCGECGQLFAAQGGRSPERCGDCTKFRHGKHGSRVYNCWTNMRSRCSNENHKSWPDYGGRGISVCRRWEKFQNFYEDMGDPPKDRSIDRIDNNEGYSPRNCRWATRTEQQSNRRICYGR